MKNLSMKILTQIMPAAFLLTVAFTSCKKTDTSSTAAVTADATQTTSVAAQSNDQATVTKQVDAIANDANTSLEASVAFNGKIDNTVGVLGTICNTTSVYDSVSAVKKITVTYNGATCDGTQLMYGTIIYTMPNAKRWKDTGAIVTITTKNLKIIRVRDSSTITLNGVKTMTNVWGGKLSTLAVGGYIEHAIIDSNMVITFDNGTQRSWQVAKKRVFTRDNNGIIITTTGLHTQDSLSGISEWGINRFGFAFTNAITTPLVVLQSCNYRLVSGTITDSSLNNSIHITYGLNAAGLPTTCPVGNYYYKIGWTNAKGEAKTAIKVY